MLCLVFHPLTDLYWHMLTRICLFLATRAYLLHLEVDAGYVGTQSLALRKTVRGYVHV